MNNGLNNLFSGLLGNGGASNEARQNDKRIEDVCMYEMTEGYTKLGDTRLQNTSPAPDQYDEEKIHKLIQTQEKFRHELGKLFKQYKRAIQRKSMTIDELEAMVYSKYGVVSKDTDYIANPLFHEDGIISLDSISVMSEGDYKKMRESFSHE